MKISITSNNRITLYVAKEELGIDANYVEYEREGKGLALFPFFDTSIRGFKKEPKAKLIRTGSTNPETYYQIQIPGSRLKFAFQGTHTMRAAKVNISGSPPVYHVEVPEEFFAKGKVPRKVGAGRALVQDEHAKARDALATLNKLVDMEVIELGLNDKHIYAIAKVRL